MINHLSEEGLVFLDSRREFWRQQKPMYARKYEVDFIKKKYCCKENVSDDYVICELEKIDAAMSLSKYKESLTAAKNCLRAAEGYTESQVANKMVLIAQLHSCMGNAYLEMGLFGKAQDHHQQDFNIGQKYGPQELKSRAMDNLGRVYARMGHLCSAIRVWENKLPMARTPIETTWLCHEIGRCYMEQGKFDQTKEYGMRALEAAEIADDKMWQLHALVLVAQAEVQVDKLTEAISFFKRALQMTKVLEDMDAEKIVENAIHELQARISATAVKSATSNLLQMRLPGVISQLFAPPAVADNGQERCQTNSE